MSKRLHLLRHAKSSWADPGAGDRERGLNKRGQRDAPRMGKALRETVAAQIVTASPARRAQLTLAGVQEGWPELAQLNHCTEENLYTFSAEDLVGWIRMQPDAEPSLFLVGHNPAFTDLVNWICGEVVVANLPTAGYAEMELALDAWSALDRGCGRLHNCVKPRELPDG